MAAEKTFNVPLRKEFQKAPKYKRAKKAVRAIREYLKKHMKSDDVKIGSSINLKVWERGIKNPPHHIKITAEKDDKNTVSAELFGTKKEEDKSKAADTSAKPAEPKKEEKEDYKRFVSNTCT